MCAGAAAHGSINAAAEGIDAVGVGEQQAIGRALAKGDAPDSTGQRTGQDSDEDDLDRLFAEVDALELPE
jgi:hypothetical protein